MPVSRGANQIYNPSALQSGPVEARPPALAPCVCPRCRWPLASVWDAPAPPTCTNQDCDFHEAGFPRVGSQPVLIDFAASLFAAEEYSDGGGYRPPAGRSERHFERLRRLGRGRNRAASSAAVRIKALAKAAAPRPRILVIGGGTVGDGAEGLYEDDDLVLVGTDVYASASTILLADAHRLPFADGSMDAVWAQAVLEHVLDPQAVVAEIHRVLKPDGLVYADTPFMQQVHEGAYDFARFTLSGHRWLFKGFSEIQSGVVGGVGTAMLWSLKYLFQALGAPVPLAALLTLPFVGLRILDRIASAGANADAASGVFFLGARAETNLPPREMLAYYARSRT